ncbi:pro-Pol polyprotein [Trichonephila clavipes]|nr:pro-Pol polyprotein [Trichonephila clavipes]
MSFGLRNAPSTFQRFINEVLFGLEFVFPYLDDILVASETEEEHKTHLKLVFDLLQKHGLRVNISKSTLGTVFRVGWKQFPCLIVKQETASKAFYEHWVCRFGVPGKIVTDQGRQFESQLFRSLAAICGAKVAHATSYHPQYNGKVERLHRTLKGAIKAHNNIKWTETLPTILLGLRTARRPDTNHTIAQMVYGSNIRLPGEFLTHPPFKLILKHFVTTFADFYGRPEANKIFASKKSKDFCS